MNDDGLYQPYRNCTLSGENGKMVTLICESDSPYRCTMDLAKLSDVANGGKMVPKEFINAAGNGYHR